MGNRCSIQQSEDSNCWLEQSPENRLYRPFRYFWATLYRVKLSNPLIILNFSLFFLSFFPSFLSFFLSFFLYSSLSVISCLISMYFPIYDETSCNLYNVFYIIRYSLDCVDLISPFCASLVVILDLLLSKINFTESINSGCWKLHTLSVS